MLNKCFLLCALCVLGAWTEARRSHRHGGLGGPGGPGAPQSELFIFREQCALKPEPGVCKALKLRYFFNIDSGRCETFEFGGCGGNDNNFLSLEACEESCTVSEDKDPCELPEAPGPCRGLVSRYLFDPALQLCRHFFYGGCFGNANNFRTMDDCRARCQRPDRGQQTTAPPEAAEVQTEPPKRQPAPGPTAEVGAVKVDGHVELLVQHRNKSKVRHQELPGPCLERVERGPCDGAERRYFYSSTRRRCQSFSFSGCGANGNNFLHRHQCIATCIHRNQRGMWGDMIRLRRKNLSKIKVTA